MSSNTQAPVLEADGSTSFSVQQLLIALTAVFLLRQLWWAVFGILNVDEFEEIQVLWLIDQGVWPWRDFLHTHLPLYNFLLHPIYAISGPTVELPALVRLVFFPIVVGIVFQIGWLARQVTGSTTAGWLAVVFFLSSARVGRKLAEMRPDTIGLALVLLGLILFVGYLRQASTRKRSLYASAVVLGISLLFTRKSVVLIPLAVFFFDRVQRRIPDLPDQIRMRRTAAFAAVMLAPIACVMLFFVGLIPFPGLNLELLLTSGIADGISELHTEMKHRILLRFIPTNLLVIAAGVMGAIEIVRRERQKPSTETPGLSLLGVYGVAGLLMLFALPVVLNHLLILPFMALSILAAWKLERAPRRTLLRFVAAALVFSNLLDIDHYDGRKSQMEGARFVQEVVGEGTPVLDSFSGFGVLRPIVGKLIYYRPAVSSGEIQLRQNRFVEEGLENRAFGAIVDQLMLSFATPRIQELANTHYEPSPDFPDIWLPKKRVVQR